MPRIRRLLPCLLATTLAVAAAQADPNAAVSSVVLEVQAVRDSLSFTESWWGERDPHYWISTEDNPHDLLRFVGLEVPQGATITRATLTVWSYNAAADDPDDYVTLWLEQTDDAAQVASPADAWARKDRGGRTIRWPTTNPGRDEPQPSPNVAPLLQQVVDRPGWTSGNAVQFFAEATQAPAHDGRQMHSYYTGRAGATRATLEVHFVVAMAPVRAEVATASSCRRAGCPPTVR